MTIEHIEYDPLIGIETVKTMASRDSYEAASRTSHELGLWHAPIQSADGDLLPEKSIMDARVRDTLRNDAYVQNGSNIQKDHIVGEMFLLNSKPNYRALGLDATWSEEFQEEVESKFMLYAESTRNYTDAARMNTFTGMVRLAVGVHTLAGEVLASAEWMKGPRPYSSALQMIDLDRLSNPNNEMDTQFLRRGVQRDKHGAPIGYWIRQAHPTDWAYGGANNTWKYVPLTRGQATGRKQWDRLQMIHIVDQWRPDQSRGVSNMVAALKEMRMTKKFRDTVLQSAVLNATYAASIESDMPQEVALQQAGGGNTDAISEYSNAYLGQIAEYMGSSRNIRFDGVKVPVFYPGTRMTLNNAGTPGGVGSDFEASMLRYISATLGVGYSELSKDFSKANYSNLRAELAGTDRRMAVQKRAVADRFATSYFRLWLEEAMNKGDITSLPRNAPNWYDGLNAEAYTACEWIGASKGQIDELKETQAAVLRINNGLSTRESELGRLGKDYRSVFRQLEREKVLAETLGLEFGTDKGTKNMINAVSGTPSDQGTNPRSEVKGETDDE